MAQDHLESGLGYQFLTSNMLIDSLQRASLKPISEIHHDDWEKCWSWYKKT